VKINPTDPKHPVTETKVIPFRSVDFKKWFQCSTEKQIHYLKIMNADSAEIVHDPTIVKRVEAKDTPIIAKVPFTKITPEEGRVNELKYKETAVLKKTPFTKRKK
jgi:hypothetical protein